MPCAFPFALQTARIADMRPTPYQMPCLDGLTRKEKLLAVAHWHFRQVITGKRKTKAQEKRHLRYSNLIRRMAHEMT